MSLAAAATSARHRPGRCGHVGAGQHRRSRHFVSRRRRSWRPPAPVAAWRRRILWSLSAGLSVPGAVFDAERLGHRPAPPIPDRRKAAPLFPGALSARRVRRRRSAARHRRVHAASGSGARRAALRCRRGARFLPARLAAGARPVRLLIKAGVPDIKPLSPATPLRIPPPGGVQDIGDRRPVAGRGLDQARAPGCSECRSSAAARASQSRRPERSRIASRRGRPRVRCRSCRTRSGWRAPAFRAHGRGWRAARGASGGRSPR